MNLIEYIFWIFAFIVFYTYIGYGLLIYPLVKIKELKKTTKKRYDKAPQNRELPRVSLVIAAYNEEDIIEQKMANNYSLDYPSELFEIVWVSDGSTDNTNSLIKRYAEQADKLPKTSLYFQPQRMGKTAAINRVMGCVSTPIVVFTDANTMLNKEAIYQIIKEFYNPEVGCVAGEKRVISKTYDGAVSSEGLYWKYESFLKEMDWRLNTAVGAAGELYAIRRELFEELPNDTLLDDFMLSMKIAQRGYKIAYCPQAYAEESGSMDMKEEEKRKVRIAAGGIQSILRLLPLLNPFKYKMLQFQYLSHRVLRWSLTPILLFSLLPLNIILAFGSNHSTLYITILILHLLFYISGGIGKYFAERSIKVKILYVPYYFLFMNISVLRGFGYLYKRNRSIVKTNGIWEKSKRKQ